MNKLILLMMKLNKKKLNLNLRTLNSLFKKTNKQTKHNIIA